MKRLVLILFHRNTASTYKAIFGKILHLKDAYLSLAIRLKSIQDTYAPTTSRHWHVNSELLY